MGGLTTARHAVTSGLDNSGEARRLALVRSAHFGHASAHRLGQERQVRRFARHLRGPVRLDLLVLHRRRTCAGSPVFAFNWWSITTKAANTCSSSRSSKRRSAKTAGPWPLAPNTPRPCQIVPSLKERVDARQRVGTPRPCQIVPSLKAVRTSQLTQRGSSTC